MRGLAQLLKEDWDAAKASEWHERAEAADGYREHEGKQRLEAKQREKSLDFREVGRQVPVQRRQREEKAAEQREKERLAAEQRLKAKMPPRCDNLHLQGHTKAVQCVAFSSDGTLVASGSGDGQDHAAVVLDVAGIRLQPSIFFGIDGSKSETKTQVEGDIDNAVPGNPGRPEVGGSLNLLASGKFQCPKTLLPACAAGRKRYLSREKATMKVLFVCFLS